MFQDQNTNDNISDLRAHPRFEPLALDAEIKSKGGEPFQAIVLDISCGGMAVAFREDVGQFTCNDRLQINFVMPKADGKLTARNDGVIVRKINKSDFGDVVNQLVIKFEKEIDENGHLYNICFYDGIRQKARIANQVEIAKADMNYLGNYRQILIDGQLRLFILTLTIGMTLAGIFFGVLSDSSPIDITEKDKLKTLLAFMLAFLSTSFASICVHKSLYIQRIDSYLSVLKERFAVFKYPRQYQGWESGVYKLRHIYNSKKCEKCCVCRKNDGSTVKTPMRAWIKNVFNRPLLLVQPMTGAYKALIEHRFWSTLKETILKKRSFGWIKSILKHPFLSIEHIIMYSSFTFIYLISIFFAFKTMKKYMPSEVYMALELVAVSLTLCIFSLFFMFFYRLHIGKYSFKELKNIWGNILSNCREVI